MLKLDPKALQDAASLTFLPGDFPSGSPAFPPVSRDELAPKSERPKGAKSIKPKFNLSVYRSTSRNMIDMLTLADRKAGLLLNANAISLTVLVSFFGRGLNTNSKLWAASLVIAATCAITVIFASLAARPLRRPRELLDIERFHSGELSPLHYGDIARLTREDFYRAYHRVCQDPELLERSMLAEIHFFANRVLDKFRMVRRAYLTMIAGILLSCLTLIFSHAVG